MPDLTNNNHNDEGISALERRISALERRISACERRISARERVTLYQSLVLCIADLFF